MWHTSSWALDTFALERCHLTTDQGSAGRKGLSVGAWTNGQVAPWALRLLNMASIHVK